MTTPAEDRAGITRFKTLEYDYGVWTDPDGAFVLYADHAALLAAKEAEIERLTDCLRVIHETMEQQRIAKESAERERDEARRERDEAVAILRDFERYTGWDAKARAKKLARAARMEEALRDLRADMRTMAEREEGLWRHYFERVEAALAPQPGEGGA